jgi:hypothetical protein
MLLPSNYSVSVAANATAVILFFLSWHPVTMEAVEIRAGRSYWVEYEGGKLRVVVMSAPLPGQPKEWTCQTNAKVVLKLPREAFLRPAF